MKAEELARKISATYSRQPTRVGREWRTFCPVHEADGGMHKPSLALWDNGERCAWKCMTGCSRASVVAALKDRGVAFGRPGRMNPEQALKEAQRREEHRVTQLRKIEAIMSDASGIYWGSPQDKYLADIRGILIPAKVVGMTGSPGVYIGRTLLMGDDPLFPGSPALIATIVDPTTYALENPRLVGLSILSLLDDGTARISTTHGKKLRSVIGSQRGFGVPFGKPGEHVVIAEGLESMLAARQLLNIEFGIATLAAPNMPLIKLPEYVRRVTIAADNDAPGLEASASLMTDLGHLGVHTERVVYGNGGGFDAADELMKMKGKS